MDITLSEFEQRNWPFKSLEVGNKPYPITKAGDSKEIRFNAQRTAHAYGSKLGKKFKTRTIDGIVYVVRVK